MKNSQPNIQYYVLILPDETSLKRERDSDANIWVRSCVQVESFPPFGLPDLPCRRKACPPALVHEINFLNVHHPHPMPLVQGISAVRHQSN